MAPAVWRVFCLAAQNRHDFLNDLPVFAAFLPGDGEQKILLLRALAHPAFEHNSSGFTVRISKKNSVRSVQGRGATVFKRLEEPEIVLF